MQFSETEWVYCNVSVPFLILQLVCLHPFRKSSSLRKVNDLAISLLTKCTLLYYDATLVFWHYSILACETSPLVCHAHQGWRPPSVSSLCQMTKCGNNSNPFFCFCDTLENMRNWIQLKLVAATMLHFILWALVKLFC